jgi:predicted nucleotidyltransferase
VSESPVRASEFAAYLPGIRRRWLLEQAGWRERRQAALEVARRAARLLRDEFSARQVFAFGSVTRDGRFDERSDIDLAVAGVDTADYLRAWSAVDCDERFRVDLVTLEDCPPSLRERIEREGIAL